MHVNKENLTYRITYQDVKNGQVFVLGDGIFLKTAEAAVDLETGEVIQKPHTTVFVRRFPKATLILGDEG